MDKARVGIIGVNNRGELSEHWHKPDGNTLVVGGMDVNDEWLAKFKKKYPKAYTTKDYRKLLERKDIDAIAVTSPDFTHEEYAVAALEAGKHVFCEKPLAITIDGCDHILDAWRKSGKHLMVGFNMRYMYMFRTMKHIADSGILGDIKAVWVRHFVKWGSDWYFHDWHAQRKYSTGLLLQKASHDIDQIHWITGHYGKRVAAFGSLDFFGGDKPNTLTCPECGEKETCADYMWHHRNKCCFRKEVDVEDNSMMIMELDNGIKASYMQCHFANEAHRNYVFIGTKGSMENHEPSMKIWVRTRGTKTESSLADWTYDVKPAEGTHGGADPVICKDFIDMILTGKEPVATPVAGRMSVAVGCCATESLRNGGKVIEVPPLPKHLKSLEK